MNIMTPIVRDPKQQKFDTRDLLANAQQQAVDRKYEDFMIIDVDSHHYETRSYKEIFNYIEDPVMRDNFIYSKGQTQHPRSTGGYQEMAGRITRYQHRATEQAPGAPHRDIGLTRKWMDSIGVDVACIFPTPMLGLGLNPVVQAEVQYARAYNRWLTENIMAEEPRMVSMLYLPMNDPVAAMKMVEDFGDKKGVIGFLVTTARYKPLYDNCYMKLYRAAGGARPADRLPFGDELGRPEHAHLQQVHRDPCARLLLVQHPALTNWVVNGIPERFPRLKSIWIESGLAWVPFVMQRLDNEYMMRSSEAPTLKRLPSDYMREMYYTSQPMEMVNNHSMLQETFKMISAETQLLYASDYPHWDMDLPSTIYDLPFLCQQAKRNILGESARKLFKLDTDLGREEGAAEGARRGGVGRRCRPVQRFFARLLLRGGGSTGSSPRPCPAML